MRSPNRPDPARVSRRQFLATSAVASATLAAATHAADSSPANQPPVPLPSTGPVQPNSKGNLPTGQIGSVTLSRLISGGNLLSGWCHQRDLLFVRNLAAAYLTEAKQLDTLQLLEESGVNSMVLDMIQLPILNDYRKQRGGQMKSVVSIRQNWGDWGMPRWDDLKLAIDETLALGPSLLYVHGGYADRLVKNGEPQHLELLGRTLQYIREQGLPAGLGAHALQVLQACDAQDIQPDFYVKTFHHDRYWSATPKDRRKPFCVDGPGSLDHNEYHDNIFCIDAEGTAAFMLEKPQPWIAFKVLAAGAIAPGSGFKFAFENGADFIAVGMFDFEVEQDVATARMILESAQRDRPWCA